MTKIKLLWLLILLILFTIPLFANDIKLNKTTISFANLDEAQSVLMKRDAYIKAMKPLERSLRMQTDQTVTEKEYFAFAKRHILSWDNKDKVKIQSIINSLRANLLKIKLKLPARILLIKTSGKEEGGALYTRSNAIFLPQNIFTRYSDSWLKHILAHEIFHVLSRYNPQIQPTLYKIIGFSKINEIELPEPIKSRKITNPDAPLNNYIIEVLYKGEPVTVVPILFSKKKRYNIKSKAGFLSYISFKLLAVEKINEKWQPIYQQDKALYFDLAQIKGYLEKTGMNTNYLIHPEEIMAENFAFLITEKKNLPSPEITSKLEKHIYTTNG